MVQLFGYNSADGKLMVFNSMSLIKPWFFYKIVYLEHHSMRFKELHWITTCFVSFLRSATMKPKVPPPLPPKVSERDYVTR